MALQQLWKGEVKFIKKDTWNDDQLLLSECKEWWWGATACFMDPNWRKMAIREMEATQCLMDLWIEEDIRVNGTNAWEIAIRLNHAKK